MKRNIILILFVVLVFAIYNYFIKILNEKKLPVATKNMIKITSTDFENGQPIPKKYTCDGENVNPSLVISGVEENAKSLILIVDDPDAPAGIWTHWLVWNIDPKVMEIKENLVPAGAVLGKTDFGEVKYGGPCPHAGTHRYFFRIYALDTVLDLPQGSSRKHLESAINGHITDEGELMGKYSR